MNIEHHSTEQDWANGTTRVWFNVDNDQYCVCAESGNYTLLDCEGYPIEAQNDNGMLEILKPLAIKAMEDETN